MPKYRNCISEFPEKFSNFRSFVSFFKGFQNSLILAFLFSLSFWAFFDTKSVCSTLFGLLYFSLVPFKKEKRFLDWNKNWQKFGLDGFDASATSVLQPAQCCHLPTCIRPSNSVGYNWWRRRQGCVCIQGTIAIVTLDCNVFYYQVASIISGLIHR